MNIHLFFGNVRTRLIGLLACAALLQANNIGAADTTPDPNFHIYLCFGQSNMEGNAAAEAQDKTSIGGRFRMLATTNFDTPKRSLGQWYAAVPPIVNPVGSLGMADYFGRTMVAALPPEVSVGVVAVAIGGCAIEMFDKDKYQTQLTDPGNWSAQLANRYYGGNPYQRLVDMAKKAQQVGVIKGVLLHQGESNNTQQDWPQKVKKVYMDLLADLGLSPDSVPLFAGETLREENGGACWGHNSVIARLPQVVPTAHVISSEGCPGNGSDPWHFNALGYRLMGRRYAEAALRLMGLDCIAHPDYSMPSTMKKFYCVRSLSLPDRLTAVPGERIAVTATFQDGHTEDVSHQVAYSAEEPSFATTGHLPSVGEFCADIEASFTDFSRKEFRRTITTDVRYFPFDESCVRSMTGTSTLNAADRVLQLGAYSSAGWVYDEGVDLSEYKYLVVQLAEPQSIGTQVRIFGQNSDFSANYAQTPIGNKTQVAIKLNALRAGGKKVSAADIRAIGFYAVKGGDLHIADVYVCNNDDFLPDAIHLLPAAGADVAQPVFDLRGLRVGSKADWHQLPRGIYVVGGRKVVR